MLKVCYKCGAEFDRERAWRYHMRMVDCVGTWYVCKRCCAVFDTPSAIKKHHSLRRGCPRLLIDAQPTNTALARLRYKKAIADYNGDTKAYMHASIKRGDHKEITDIIEACSLVDLRIFFELLNSEPDDAKLYDLLGAIVDFANLSTTSLEKRARIKAFAATKITIGV